MLVCHKTLSATLEEYYTTYYYSVFFSNFAVQTFTSSMDALSSLWESTEGELKTIVFLIGSLVAVSLHIHYCPSY